MANEDEEYIKSVACFPNGMLAAFNQHGHQMPTFQGKTTDMLDKVRKQIEEQEFKDVEWMALDGWQGGRT